MSSQISISKDCPLVLGSASPRRREILEILRLPHLVRVVSVDESVLDGEAAAAYVERVTRLKSAAAVAKSPRQVTLVADTSVTYDGRILGKPGNEAAAKDMLFALSGRSHEVLTGYAIWASGWPEPHFRLVTTEVQFKELSPSEVDGYVASGEGADKAGAYAIQGLGSFMVARIAGSYQNVVGLPGAELISDLRKLALLGDYP